MQQTWLHGSGEPLAEMGWVYNNTAGSGSSHGQLLVELSEHDGFTVTRQFGYDGFGRPETVTTAIDDGVVNGQSWVEETTYDEFGRIFQQFDAAGDALDIPLGTRFVYDGNGHLRTLREAAYGANGRHYVQFDSQDARGNIVGMTYANSANTMRLFDPATGRLEWIGTESTHINGLGIQDLSYDWDTLGNLQYRHDQSMLPDSSFKDFHEAFAYDGLNRLRTVTLNAPGVNGQITQSLSYDAAGNVQVKDGVSYTYGYESNTGGCASAGPHAVCERGTDSYTYDANGNQISGAGRTITYTAFERTHSATRDNNTSTFWYDAGMNWIKRETQGQDPETLYRIGTVEIVLKSGQATEYRRMVGDGVQVSHFDSQPSNPQERYLHKDHLGSIDAITDENGQIVETFSFGAYGARRSHSNWLNGVDITQISAYRDITSKGFTGHEMVDGVGIIHMGGRIYDPELGRFLQADPFVQAPDNSQNLNRYSYVLNNPLSYTDPSGFFFKGLFKALKIAAAIAITVYTGGVGAGIFSLGIISGGLAGIGIAAAGGFVAGFISTGNLTGAVIGAFTGAIFSGFAQTIAGAAGAAGTGILGSGLNAGQLAGSAIGSGLISGMLSKIQGGRFGHGFLSAAGPALAGPGLGAIKNTFGRGVASAVLGGTISEATGGKFANGAVTAGFSYVVNLSLRLGSNAPPDSNPDASGDNRFTNEQKAEILEKINNLSMDLKSESFTSPRNAAVALHENVGLRSLSTEYNIELWAVIDQSTSSIKEVSTGFSAGFAIGVFDGSFANGDSVWHTRPSGGGVHIGDFQSAIRAAANNIFASGRVLSGFEVNPNRPFKNYSSYQNFEGKYTVTEIEYVGSGIWQEFDTTFIKD